MTIIYKEPLLLTRRAKGLKGRIKHNYTNLPETLLTAILTVRHGGQKQNMKKKRRVKSCKLSKEKNKQALSYFLASTWQNWMEKRGEKKGDLVASASQPLSALSAAGGESVRQLTWQSVNRDTHRDWCQQYSNPTPDHTYHTNLPSLSHGALVSTDQAFNRSHDGGHVVICTWD